MVCARFCSPEQILRIFGLDFCADFRVIFELFFDRFLGSFSTPKIIHFLSPPNSSTRGSIFGHQNSSTHPLKNDLKNDLF
nr:MAG TPA: hypothetical protein [Caudoviricetes sp.]